MSTQSKKKMPSFYAVNWNFNGDNIEFYDVFPYLIRCWEKKVDDTKRLIRNISKRKNKTPREYEDTHLPSTYEEYKKFVLDEARYQFWSRCQYEVIVTGWPVQKKEHKLDVFEQIEANIDIITKAFMDYVSE